MKRVTPPPPPFPSAVPCVARYADGECSVTIGESVVGKDVFVVSPTHSNDSLIETLLIIAAARR